MVVGYYVDDFSTLLISGYFFSKFLKPMGFRLKDVFIPDISKEVASESIRFGAGVMLFVLSYQGVGTVVSLIYTSFLPNYSSFIGVLSVLGPIMGLSETVNGIHVSNHRAAVSEAYFNDKKHYAAYILSNGFRTMSQITGMITPLVLALGGEIVGIFFAEYTSTFSKIFVYVLIHRTIFQHSHLMNEVLIGTGHHKFNVLITVIEQVVSLTMVIACIILKLGIFVLIIPGYFQTLIKQGIGWVYINRKIINLRFNPWQFWIVPAISGFLYYLIIQGFHALFSFVFGATISSITLLLLGIYLLPGPCYFFFLGMLGGYDEHTMTDLENAMELSGPSKIIVKPWFRCTKAGAMISGLHGRFPMFFKNVQKEINELMAMKKTVTGNMREETSAPR
ncbi:hypothetical protein GF325_11890 [Candidatus Bathyarchaeota archaeon]|nr:hypothetical protein [Candidatus Bathyarchaeota archaeon]